MKCTIKTNHCEHYVSILSTKCHLIVVLCVIFFKTRIIAQSWIAGTGWQWYLDSFRIFWLVQTLHFFWGLSFFSVGGMGAIKCLSVKRAMASSLGISGVFSVKSKDAIILLWKSSSGFLPPSFLYSESYSGATAELGARQAPYTTSCFS